MTITSAIFLFKKNLYTSLHYLLSTPTIDKSMTILYHNHLVSSLANKSPMKLTLSKSIELAYLCTLVTTSENGKKKSNLIVICTVFLPYENEETGDLANKKINKNCSRKMYFNSLPPAGYNSGIVYY
jgi:hypothetical protein